MTSNELINYTRCVFKGQRNGKLKIGENYAQLF